MADTPPPWAITRACEITGVPMAFSGGLVMEHFARYIAQHEDPPLDPLLAEAQKIVAEILGTKTDNHWAVVTVLTALRRGVEIGKAHG